MSTSAKPNYESVDTGAVLADEGMSLIDNGAPKLSTRKHPYKFVAILAAVCVVCLGLFARGGSSGASKSISLLRTGADPYAGLQDNGCFRSTYCRWSSLTCGQHVHGGGSQFDCFDANMNPIASFRGFRAIKPQSPDFYDWYTQEGIQASLNEWDVHNWSLWGSNECSTSSRVELGPGGAFVHYFENEDSQATMICNEWWSSGDWYSACDLCRG